VNERGGPEADMEQKSASGRRSPALRVIAAIVTLGSLVAVAWLLDNAWPDLMAHHDQLEWALLAGGTLVALVSSYMTFEVFVILVRSTRTASLSRLQLAHVYYTSQLLRHLPGRVWGIGYQWMAGARGGSLGEWVAVNLGHMALAVYFALWSSSLVIAFAANGIWGLAAILAGLIGYAIVWNAVGSAKVGQMLGLLPARAAAFLRRFFAALAQTPVPMRVRVLFLLSAGWALLYGAWFLYGAAYPPLGALGGVQLCAYYLIAWFVGYVSFVTPSGLGVRELVFVWLAKDFPADAAALMAIIGRVSLLIVDLLMGLSFSYFIPDRVRDLTRKE
jgi:glycosyltransferase 2 family protein